MTVEVSTLQVKVMSDGIKEATDGLNSLVKAATEAESKSVILKSATEDVSKSQGASASAADKLLKKFQETVDLLGANTEKTYSYKAASKGLSDEQQALAGQLGSQVDTYRALVAQQREAEKQSRALAQAEEDYARIHGQAIEMDKRYDRRKQAQEWRELGQAQAEANRMERERNSELARTAATTARVEKQQRDFIATLKDQAETAKMTASELTAYRAAQLGVTDQAAPYVAKLKEMEKANNLTGVSAKQAAFAFKMLPAQMSDITVQLAGGQNPFLVLLQQGSQIKDSFGGISNTFKALGEALTPARLAFGGVAAAVALFGVAVYQNQSIVKDFNKQMILTSDWAGITKDQFLDLATSIGKIAGGKNAAAAALTEIAGSGKVAADNIESVGVAAAVMQKIAGQSVEKTISQFVAIQKDPVDAVLKLNEQYHFLTLGIFEQIQALESQGEYEKAVKLAWDTYTEAMKTKTPQVLDNLNAIEKGWEKVKEAAKNAWASIGAEESTSQKIQKLQERIDFNNKSAGGLTGPSQKAVDNANAILQSQIDLLKFNEQLNTSVQKRANEENKINDEALKASAEIKKRLESIKGPEKLNKDLTNIKKLFEDLYAKDPTAPLLKGVKFKDGSPVSGGDYQKLVDEVNRKDLRKTPTNEYDKNARLKELQGTLEEERRLLDRNNIANKNDYDLGIENLKEYLLRDYTLRQESLEKQEKIVQQQIEVARNKKNLEAQEKYKNDLKKLQDEEIKNKDEYDAKTKKADAEEKARIENYLEGLRNVVENRRKEIENMSIGAGMGDRQREDMKRALKIQEEYQAQLQALNKKFPIKEARDNSTEYQTELAGLKKQLDDRLTLEQKYKDDRVKLESDWQAGASDAWQNYLDSTKDVAGQTKTLFTNAFNGLEDALTNFVTTGKLSFGDFAKTIIAQLIKMQLAAAATGLFNMFTGSVGSALSSPDINQSASGFITGALKNANGNAFENGAVAKFADGGAFTNGIVSSPTSFDIGQMGEAGPEAIVPLTRTSDGSLGVTMKGAGGGDTGPVTVSNNITINNDGSASATSSTVGSQQEQAKAFSQVMENVAKQTIYKEMQQGGSLWKMKNGQR